MKILLLVLNGVWNAFHLKVSETLLNIHIGKLLHQIRQKLLMGFKF